MVKLNRRLFSRVALGLAVLALVLWVPGAERQERDPLTRVSGPFHFNLASWEFKNLPQRWWYQLTQGFRQPDPTSPASLQKVTRYFDLAERIGELERKLEEVHSGLGAAEEEKQVRQELEQLRKQRDKLKGDVEFIIERLITNVIAEEGLTSSFLWFEYVWPPVDFTFDRLPRVLVVSPRDRIEQLRTQLLTTDMSLDKIEQLEQQVEGQNLSALVESLGGVATYPAIVRNTSALASALSLAAHEWMHHYLFFKPLGSNYGSSDKMTTINETVANIWGDEVANLLLCRYWDRCPQPQPDGPSEGTQETNNKGFSFAREMRSIRLKVDELLAEGKVEEAEAFMEERRRFLAEHGYFIRKLNQAYFAFHGSYADTPTSVDPLGEQLKALRRQSASLGEFIRTVRDISSFEEYQEKVLPLVEGDTNSLTPLESFSSGAGPSAGAVPRP
jgi:hypothetical protein